MEKSTLSIKETLSITFRTLKILFHAAPGGIVFLGILSTIAGVCPFLTLILSRAFLDSLARACGQQAFEMEIIWLLFFLFLTNMMLSVVNNLSILLKSDVSGRISLLVNAQVLEKCVHLPMSQYDNETTYNRIRFTSEQTSIRCTNLINTVFSIVQCLISFASVVCVLVSFNGIIVIASVVASIPLFFVNKYVSSFWYKISVGRVEKQRYSDVLRDLMLRNDNIKELKLFGSLSYLKSRILNQQTDFFREDQMNRKKFCKIDTAQKAANDFVILLLKLWIIILGIKQRATLGTINLYTSSLDQIQSAIFSFCTQLNTFYEQALYLESLFDLFDMQTEDENCGTPLTEPIRTIEFRHVYFSYPATNVYALKNVSFVLDDRHTYVFDELVFDVNTDYFETHGGYEYAKQFYAEVYELAKEIAGGEQYIISAVMHADERNREASDRLGRNVFHYHLHVVYLPVVEKQIRWSKRCKDPALRGTVRETIMQVSHSKKWPMVPMTDEQGQPVLKKNGKPRLVSSYSLLQTQFFEHMRQAGFTDFERGIEGSDAEHLNVLEYKVQKERQTVAELSDQTKQLQGQRKELIFQVKNISSSIRDVVDIEQRAKTKGVLEKRVELPVQDFQTLCEMAKASGKLQAENRSLRMQLQQSTMREQELRQRLRRCEEQLDAVLTETRPYREAMRVAPEQVQAFVLGICRRQQEEKGLNRQQRRQRAKGQDR